MSSEIKEVETSTNSDASQTAEVFERPTGLRGIYYHPKTQIVMLGFVCFMCPGMYNALSGLGGGGQITATVSSNSNSALYATYAFLGFFSGSICNVIGIQVTLFLGTLGYALYVGSFLAINIHPGAGDFVIAAGALLGMTAAFLWTAQGAIMMSYPTESQKGLFVGIFWSIFNLGAVVGAAVSFGQNFHSQTNSVGNGTYVGFLVLTLIGVTIPFMMAKPTKMIRTDGTKVVPLRHPSWKSEFIRLWLSVKEDPMILLLFPMFFASNYFYTWQFNDYNGALFDIRARALNNLMYWMSQIFGSIAIGLLLDQKRLRRRVRAFLGWTVLLVLAFVVHIWAYFYQRTYTRESDPPSSIKMDFSNSAFAAHVWLMILYGLFDAMWQTNIFWLLGAMTNDPSRLSIYAGFFHSLQSAGAAGVWRADAVGLPYMNIFISTWCVVAAGLVFSFPMIYFRVRDHTELIEGELPQLEHFESPQGKAAETEA